MYRTAVTIALARESKEKKYFISANFSLCAATTKSTPQQTRRDESKMQFTNARATAKKLKSVSIMQGTKKKKKKKGDSLMINTFSFVTVSNHH
jgi:hypothetical protein